MKTNRIIQLTITGCSPAKKKDGTLLEGVGKTGKPWKLYDIKANGKDGQPFQELWLKSFKEYEAGHTGYFEVEVNPDYPKQGTIKEPSQATINELKLAGIEAFLGNKFDDFKPTEIGEESNDVPEANKGQVGDSAASPTPDQEPPIDG